MTNEFYTYGNPENFMLIALLSLQIFCFANDTFFGKFLVKYLG